MHDFFPVAQALHDLFTLPTDTCALCKIHPFLSTASKICAKIVIMHYKDFFHILIRYVLWINRLLMENNVKYILTETPKRKSEIC